MVNIVMWHVKRPYPGAAVTTSVGLIRNTFVPTEIPSSRAFVFVYDGEQVETIETMFREIAKLDASAELKLDEHYLYIVHYNKVAAKLFDDTATIIAQKDAALTQQDAEIAYLKAQLAHERASRISSFDLQKRKRNHRKRNHRSWLYD